MLSLLLSLSLGQTVRPPVNTAPYGFVAPLEPIRIEGPPAMLRRGVNITAVWSDRRRGNDQNDAGLDLWAGTWSPLGGLITQSLLTREPGPCGQPRVIEESAASLMAAWVCLSTDGGPGFVETTTTATGTFPRFPPVTVPNDNAAGPIQEFAASSVPSTTVLAVRRPGAISLLATRPLAPPFVFPGVFRSLSLAETDGGLTALAVTAQGLVGSYSSIGSISPLATNTNFVVAIPTQPDSTFVYQSTSNEVRLRVPDGGTAVFGTNALSLPPLVARSGSNTLALFRTDGGLAARVIDQNLLMTAATVSDGGLPLSLTGDSVPFTMAELQPGEVVLRDVTISGTTPIFSSTVYHPFLAPAPQRSVAAVWSDLEQGFLTLWDERAGAGWELKAGVIDNGSAQPLLNQASSAAPLAPSLTTGPDGGVYATITVGGVRTIMTYRGGLVAQVGVGLDETVVGASSFFTWSPLASTGRHSSWATPRALDPVPRGCVARGAGGYWYAPAAGSTLNGISETGQSLSSTAVMPATMPPFERCLTIGDTGAMHVTVSGPGSVEVFELTNGTRKGSFALTPSESPAVVDVGPGVLAVVAVVPAGQPTLWFAYAGAVSTVAPLTLETQPVRNVRAAKAPNGDVLASWESFDLESGAWRMAARIIQAPYPGATDGGVFDAGLDAGVFDAGSNDGGRNDAGAPDAGLNDAGGFDAGVPDAGKTDDGGIDEGDAGRFTDAGLVDGGVTDAGASLDAGVSPDAGPELQPVFVAVCGCSSSGSLPALLLGLLVLLRRNRGGRT
ncbi:MAG: hypothetical protein GQE15_18270 [Archangiaceae bacterium]|nr:hypothetical protein [Archangiaceae bacterium]